MQEKLNKKVAPYYNKIKKELSWLQKECPDGDLTWFVSQCGNNYPSTPNDGIVFYGRANNGWDPEDNHSMEEISHQTHRPFFNLMKLVSESYYPFEWYSHVAWSNVCKITPWSGKNPSNTLWYRQEQYMSAIIKEELDVLSPRVVIIITGNTASAKWDAPFFYNTDLEKYKLCDMIWLSSEENYKNHKNCTATLYKKDGRLYIITDRPECRPIEPHANCIIELIEKYK